MAINSPFTIKNGLSIGSPTGATALIDSSGNWVGPSTNLVGPTGPQGPQGLTGPTGVAGPGGPVGPQGPQGLEGPIGNLGPQGAQGATGPRGPQGPQGSSGAAGPQGAAGPSGPQGPQGTEGPQGPSPAGAIGPQGPQGVAGATGPQGPTGPNGAQGAIGPRGPQGAEGPQGSTPPPGPNGDQGQQGPTGVTGPTGPQGPQGSRGPRGPQGPNTTLQSTVSSLGVGTPASGTTGEIRATNNITGFYSDVRLKDNISTIVEAKQILEKLRGVYFNQNELAEQFGYHDHSKQIGVIAQEVQEVVPEAVTIAPFDFMVGTSKSGENYLTVNYLKLIPVIVEVIKLHQHEINMIKGQVK